MLFPKFYPKPFFSQSSTQDPNFSYYICSFMTPKSLSPGQTTPVTNILRPSECLHRHLTLNIHTHVPIICSFSVFPILVKNVTIHHDAQTRHTGALLLYRLCFWAGSYPNQMSFSWIFLSLISNTCNSFFHSFLNVNLTMSLKIGICVIITYMINGSSSWHTNLYIKSTFLTFIIRFL